MKEAESAQLVTVVQTFLSHLGIPGQVAVALPERAEPAERVPLLVSITTEADANMLIGKNGQNLQALEHVLRAIRARQNPGNPAVRVDVNDYRKEKAQEIIALVKQVAERVRETRKSEALDPMNPADRRLVHTELASYHDLATESMGVEPRRRVVIRPL